MRTNSCGKLVFGQCSDIETKKILERGKGWSRHERWEKMERMEIRNTSRGQGPKMGNRERNYSVDLTARKGEGRKKMTRRTRRLIMKKSWIIL